MHCPSCKRVTGIGKGVRFCGRHMAKRGLPRPRCDDCGALVNPATYNPKYATYCLPCRVRRTLARRLAA